MTEIAEGLGAAIEGSLTAKAVEPDAGEISPSAREAIECANCGTSFAGNYCTNCGQKAHIHRTLTAIAHDLIHGVLHLDGKLSHTLPLLVFKPGRLTRRYIEGERAKFVSPMSMFLFSVFSMFAVFQIVGISTPTTFEQDAGLEQVESSLSAALEKQQAGLVDVQERLSATDLDDEARAELEAQKADIEESIVNIGKIADMPFIDLEQPKIEVNEDGNRVVPINSDGGAKMTFSETGFEFLDKGLAKKWQENPGLMLYKLQANAYKFSWLLIPLSIPFVWLTFAWRRRFKAYDHAIFVTYSLAFMSLLFITASLFTLSPEWMWVGGLLMVFVPPIHLYKHLRYTYGLSRFSAFWRLMALSAFIWVVIGLFLQTLLILGAF